MKHYMFRADPLSIIMSLFTVHSVVVYVIQVCIHPGPAPNIAESTVNKLLLMDRGTARNM
jgi:hypothetical protein